MAKVERLLLHWGARRVQLEAGLKSQDGAERWPVYHREGRDSEAAAERETAGWNDDLEITGLMCS